MGYRTRDSQRGGGGFANQTFVLDETFFTKNVFWSKGESSPFRDFRDFTTSFWGQKGWYLSGRFQICAFCTTFNQEITFAAKVLKIEISSGESTRVAVKCLCEYLVKYLSPCASIDTKLIEGWKNDPMIQPELFRTNSRTGLSHC